MGIVTPEAVALELREATVGTRSLAFLIDVAVQAAFAIGLVLAGVALEANGVFDGLPTWLGGVLVAVVSFALLWGYPVAFEMLMRGRTPGKAAMGLRVVTRDGAPVRLRHAALRGIFLIVDVYASSGSVGALSVILTRRHQRVGDLIAGTVVLRERLPRRTGQDVSVGRHDETLLRSLDTSRVSAADLGAATAFLQRSGRMAPDARRSLATQLADRLLERTAARPPEGMSAEQFVGLVVAAVREREGPGRREEVGRPAGPAPVAGPRPRPAQTGAGGAADVDAGRDAPSGGFAPPV